MTIGVMIPIKEESQRVPNKTFRVLGDKTLAFWIIDTLLDVDYFDLDIWINTDSNDVIELYESSGYDLNYYMRPDHLQGHEVSMNAIIKDWLNHCEDYGYSFYLQTHITNPFLRVELIEDALSEGEYYAQGSHRSILGVTRHQCRMWYKAIPVNFTLGQVIQTQDLIPVFEDNSCLYVFDRPGFFQWRGRVSPNPYMLEIPWPDHIDIDTEEEWNLAEIIARQFL